MVSPLDRRRFLATVGTEIAAGVAVTTSAASLLADDSPPDVPLPDAGTLKPVAAADAKPVCCDPASTLIFACSGAADVGEIADHAARQLMKDGAGKMFCLAGVGGRVDGIMENTKKAQTLLVIDGCPLQCSRNTLEKAGFTEFKHVCLSDLGMAKGATPVTDEAVARVAAQGKKALGE
jgi:uncharacterized metal-binding protein